MRIQIIGLGIVGTAQAYLSKGLGHDVIGYDVVPVSNPYCTVIDSYSKDADITFVCTPEDVLEEVIQNLVNIKYKGIVAIRSTAPIGTTKDLSDKFNMHVCHNPEFLKEETYLEDIINPNIIIIGQCCKIHGDVLEEFYGPMNRPIVRVGATTSELIKLTNNAYLSMLITFWNEIDELCDKLDIDTKNLSDIVSQDSRVSNYGKDFFGIPYGGKCLPKDIDHLITGFRTQKLNPKLFEACQNYNNKLIKKLDKKDK